MCMNIYSFNPKLDFTVNRSYFNCVVKSEMTLFFIRPIENILLQSDLNDTEKIERIKKIQEIFSERRVQFTAWEDALIDFYQKK